MTELSKEKKKKMKQNIYATMAKYFFIFFSLAIGSSFLGRFIDNQFDIKPYGTIGLMLVSMFFSWVIVFITYQKMKLVPSEGQEKDKNGE